MQFSGKAAWLCRAGLLAALTIVPGGVIAADLRIGFLDAERINRESAPADRAMKKLEKEFAPRLSKLQETEQSIKSQQATLDRDGPTLGETERRNREQELARLTRDFQRLQREYREDLNLRRNEELSALFERANRVIRQIAESEKFDLILQEAVYRSPRIDITDKVLKALADK